jgi:predicted site-specific integrase-resolvase
MDDEIWMTAQEAADHFGVKLFTIYSWVRRGRLQVGGLDERGRKVFRLLDVALVEKATRAKAKRICLKA